MASKIKFIRQDIHKKKRLDSKWRKPRGCDSKKRLMKNNRLMVKPGYGSNQKDFGKHFTGKEIISVSTLDELKQVNPKTQIVVLSGKIGFRRKKELLEYALKNQIVLTNIKDPKKYVENKTKLMTQKRQEKDKKKDTKRKEDKKAETKETKEDSIEDKLTEEDKKKIEKQEIDRLLTKKF